MSGFIYSQNKVKPKDTLYILYNEYKKSNCIKKTEKYNLPKRKGTVFSIPCEFYSSFLFKEKDSLKVLELCSKHLEEYKFVNEKEIKELEKKYSNKGNNVFTRNNIFVTYLIEVINKKDNTLIIYPVEWIEPILDMEINRRYGN